MTVPPEYRHSRRVVALVAAVVLGGAAVAAVWLHVPQWTFDAAAKIWHAVHALLS